MKANKHSLYLEDLQKVCKLDLPWDKVAGHAFLISGATGLLGSFLVDVLMLKGAKVCALGRNASRAASVFEQWLGSGDFESVSHDINLPLDLEGRRFDYVIHLASNTHPVAYSTEPVSTITTNIGGTMNMLEAARLSGARFAFASSNEIYGQNRGDCELFKEDYCGYIDSNTLRAGYPESKRCGEALCQAYARQYGLDVVIPRFTRSFGPTLLSSDTKAATQFIRNGVDGVDIVLKSEGKQFYSYTYMADAVSGLLHIILKGESGLAYNIADESCDVTLRDLASLIAAETGTMVIFELPSETEKAGFSTAVKARLDGSRLRALGWRPLYDIRGGIVRTLQILRDCR
ncbi:MAG: NAD-dependent epimerase/dehydratase family protein [Bacteroidales bacterium]|nr:NAD-dependent epimerase/dehydratase family protein [Candidatus Cryptobacteroides aphodequi]